MKNKVPQQVQQPKVSPQDAQQALTHLDFLICNKTNATLNELNNATTAIRALVAFISQNQPATSQQPEAK